MKSLRNNRRVLGAILLTLVCVVTSAAPAAAFGDRGATIDERSESRVSSLLDRFEAGISSFLSKLGITWAADGAHIED